MVVLLVRADNSGEDAFRRLHYGIRADPELLEEDRTGSARPERREVDDLPAGDRRRAGQRLNRSVGLPSPLALRRQEGQKEEDKAGPKLGPLAEE